jgi:hypothetical protein
LHQNHHHLRQRWLWQVDLNFQQQVRPPLLPRSNLHKNKLVRPLLLVKNPI